MNTFSSFAFVALGVSLGAVACGSSDDPQESTTPTTNPTTPGPGDDGGSKDPEGSDGSTSNSACITTTRALCAKACGCAGPGKECSIAYRNVAFETHESQAL